MTLRPLPFCDLLLRVGGFVFRTFAESEDSNIEFRDECDVRPLPSWSELIFFFNSFRCFVFDDEMMESIGIDLEDARGESPADEFSLLGELDSTNNCVSSTFLRFFL